MGVRDVGPRATGEGRNEPQKPRKLGGLKGGKHKNGDAMYPVKEVRKG
jgi:hypothetical protein